MTVPLPARDFQGQRAGVVSRVLAATIDCAVLVTALLAVWLGWAAVRFLLHPTTFSFPAPSLALVVAEGWVVAVLYLTASWATTGRSYGGHLLGLRVVNFRGRRMSWPGAFVRAGFCVLFPVGLGWSAVSRSNRSVQDVAMRTSVVYDWAAGGRSDSGVPQGQAWGGP
jgi:uncharacterized RDD family membrane protein YckC